MWAGEGSAAEPRARVSARLPESPATAARARSFVVETLRGWRVGSGAVDDAELVVSELVTNAFLHGHATEVGVSLADHGVVARLEVVHDEPPSAAPTELAPLTVAADQVHGRGLAIVDVLSRAWGVEESDGERRVWADLAAARTGLVPGPDRDDALAALAAALDDAADVRAVGTTLTGWAGARLATSFAGVALPDVDDPGQLRYLHVEPLPTGGAETSSRFPVDTDAPVAAAFRQARPYFHESRNAAVVGFPELGPALAASEMVALAHLPLLDAGRPVGTLALAWSHGRELDSGDRSWLAAVAAVAAAALVRLGAGRHDDALTDGSVAR